MDLWEIFETEIEIDLKLTLFSGQVFHFKEVDTNEYAGVLGITPIILKQFGKKIMFLKTRENVESILKEFFNLDIKEETEIIIPGLRFLSNDVISTIFSFICSSNNNIKRISKMVEYLYTKGDLLESFSLNEPNKENRINIPYKNESLKDAFSYKSYVFRCFPNLNLLLEIENELRQEKFGYRSNFICNAAEYLIRNPIDLKNQDYLTARKYLMNIKGIGRKVADCICLISLKMFDVVPIDTHVFKYSLKRFDLDIKLLNDTNYNLIQSKWKEVYGKQSGIAQLHIFKSSVDKIKKKEPS